MLGTRDAGIVGDGVGFFEGIKDCTFVGKTLVAESDFEGTAVGFLLGWGGLITETLELKLVEDWIRNSFDAIAPNDRIAFKSAKATIHKSKYDVVEEKFMIP